MPGKCLIIGRATRSIILIRDENSSRPSSPNFNNRGVDSSSLKKPDFDTVGVSLILKKHGLEAVVIIGGAAGSRGKNFNNWGVLITAGGGELRIRCFKCS